MIVRIIGLVFLFIIRIRFPRGKSIADIIRNRYGEAFVKKIRRFEKCDFKLRKCHLDLRFLLDCKKNGVIPKFLRFKLANRHLNNSHVYRKCQLRLLEEEIKSKRKRINTLENDTQKVKEELQRTFSVLDFSCICSLFLVANDKSILQHDNIHKRKLQNLLKISSNNIFSDSHNPDRVIFNFSSYKLTDDEKNVLCKGLNFSVKPGLIEYSEFLLPFELLFRDIKREDICNEDMSVIKARLLDTALTSYQNFSRDREPPENLTFSEFKALKRLSKNKDIVIQKADKGNTVVILDKCSYIRAIEEILNDNSKFSKLDIPTGKEINHIVNLEKRITSELKLLKDREIIDKSIYKSIKPVGSRPGILYGLGKIHKETRNGIPPFRPILSAIGTPTYNLAKFLLKFLTPSTANEFTVIDSFHFAEEISQQDSNLHMASLDVDSLFTNIPLEETIDICVDNLYSDNENPPNIPKHNFRNLLNIATKETFFMFNNKYYKQVDGVAMGSPLGPALANIFMCSFENKWLRDCPNDFKPVFYRRYIDDIFVLFSSPDHADKFREYLSSKHPNIKFSIEKEEDGCLPFLDVNIFRENDKFATNVYRKKTFSGVYTNFKSFIPETYKIGLIKSLLFRCFSLCSDFIKFHHEIDKLKSILYRNSYPRDLVDKCIKEFLYKILAPKPVVSTVPKKNLVIGLPYLGKLSLQIRTRINRIMKNKLPYCNIRFVFQTKCKISNFFTFKDKIPSFLRSGIVYKFQCGSCNATYYGKTKRHFKVRICEHLGISVLTGKRVKGDDDSAIKEHLLFCNHTPDFEDFSILASNNNDFKVTLMESLLINRDHPPLNKNKQSLPLELFDS